MPVIEPTSAPQDSSCAGAPLKSWKSRISGIRPSAIYFRVRTQDGDYFVLRHDEAQDVWSLDAFRSARERQPLPEAPQVGLS